MVLKLHCTDMLLNSILLVLIKKQTDLKAYMGKWLGHGLNPLKTRVRTPRSEGYGSTHD